jgi:NAD(P)-dependent dehydrogenase (short-subunit alcohol dehydrogenase family)
MESKIILVTGTTQGIGKITATALAKQGHRIIIHGRSKSKLIAVQEEIIKETGNKKIDIAVADLLSMTDTKRMADELKSKYNSLDVLINNAGAIFNKDRELTNEGHEKTIALNLHAPFLLMQLLLPLLQKSSDARIINLSSAMHKRGGTPDFTDFNLVNSYKPDRAYGLSKLYLIWVSRHMAIDLKSKGINNVTVNVCHPGAVATNFGQDSKKGFIIDIIFKAALWVMPKPEVGAQTSIYLASSAEVKNTTGQFYGYKKNIEKPDERYYTAENEQKVWDYCLKTIQKYL